ncbi:MAG: leucine-rich repeat protein [Muribaculaceae bacterium]|nr:leucine-rich repeat protein [Muribaculaceae bacterium]
MFKGVTYATEIGRDAFYGTSWYNNQKDGILYLSEGNGNTICYGYKGAQPTGTLTIKDGTTLIADMAFAGCIGITDVIIPSSIKYVGAGAFDGTSWDSNQNGILYSGDICLGISASSAYIKGDLVIKEGTTKIISNAFLNAEISSLTIPNSVTEIGSNAFGGCWLLTRVTIEDGTTDLSGARFDGSPLETIYLGRNSDFVPSDSNSPTIKEVTIGNSVTEIGYGAFYGCTGLTSVTIPNSVTTINGNAFSGCTGLTDVTIGNSVTYIGSGAFYGTGCYNNCSDGEFVYVDNCLVDFKGDPYAYNGGYLYRNKTQIIKEGTRLVSLDGADMRSLSPTEIISLSATPPILSTLGSYYGEYKDRIGMLYVPSDAYNAYWMSDTWSAVFSNIKPLTVVSTISVEAPSTCVLGDSIQLNAVVMPNNASFPTIKWTSSNEEVATVDKNGLLKYLKEGKTTVTATAADGSGVSTSFEIEVKAIMVSSITLNHDRLRLDVDSVATLTATFAPENASYKTAEWSVSDSTIVALADNGDGTATIKQLAEGTAYIYVCTIDGTNLADTCEVTTIQLVEAITLDPTAITLPLYESTTITATIEPATTDNKDLTWTSSAPSIAAVKEDANGNCVVVMMAEGTATITATATDGSEITATSLVSTHPLVKSITLDKTEVSLMIGETATLTYTLEPTDAHNPIVKWRSNNERVASVTDNGDGSATIKAIASGEAIVSVFSTDGTNVITDCHVIVGNTFVYNGITYRKTSDSEVSVIAGAEKYANDIDIPAIAISENKEYNVTAIADSAFYQCDSLTAITLPDGLNTIGKHVFLECTKIKTIVVPNSVTAIGGGAFKLCSSLENISLSENIKEIAYYMFNGCSNLNSVNLQNVYTIGEGAFMDCSQLEEIVLSDSLSIIHKKAFSRCKALCSIVLPNGITTIDVDAFAGCRKITKIYSKAVVPPTVASDFPNYSASLAVPADALEAYKAADYWKNFTNIVGVGELTDGTTFVVDGITYKKVAEGQAEVTYGDVAYTGDITIPASVTYANLDYEIIAVSDSAFYRCEGLTAITLPESLKTIGKRSFSLCLNIKSIIVPNSVISIDGAAFANCTSLESITLPNEIKTLGNFLLYNNISLKSIIIPDAVVSIRDNCFQNCTSLTEILFPENIAAIGHDAFLGCNNITKLYSNAVVPPTVVNGFPNYSASLYVQPQSVEAYVAAEYWKNFNVKAIPGIALDATEMEMNIGDEVTLTATIDPADITDSQIKWSSSDDDIAMVDDNGKVVALTPGKAIITATTADGRTIDGVCVVNVSNVVTLAIKDCEAATIVITTEYGKTESIAIEATVGWEINSVTFNGEDVTADFIAGELFTTPAIVEDSELVITYSSKSVDVEDITAQAKDVKVYGYDNTITIKGADVGSVVEVVDTKGVVIYSGIEKSITIDNDGVYIVTVEGRTFKLAL